MEHQCILLVRTEKNNEVKYLLYLCQKKRKGQETVNFSVQNTHSTCFTTG